MRLRSISKNVKEQNWFAVLLDFFIVVLGVFIGIQLGNWNDARHTRSAFVEAKDNLSAEYQANLEMVDKFIEDVEARTKLVRGAISALRECEKGDQAIEQVAKGANAARGTPTLHLRQTALSKITTNDAYLSLVEKKDRERLKEFERRLSQAQATLNWLEDRPFENHIEDSPHISNGHLIPLSTNESVMIRNLTVNAPMDEICSDQTFAGPFYLWERTATFQSLRARQIRTWLSEARDGRNEAS